MPSGVVQVHRPRAIVLDILGTASKSGFLERILFPYLKLNLESYLNTHWDKSDFIKLFKRIRDQSVEFNRQEPSTPVVAAHMAPEAKSTLVAFINFVTDNGVNSPAVTQLRFKVWFEGFNQMRIKTPIYSDVPNSLKRWYAEGIKFYVFSNTWVEAQKNLLRNTNHGDLTNLIAGNFDNDFGLLTEPDSWRRFCAQISQSPNNVLFLTKSVQEGRAAQDAGLAVVLVLTHRHNVKALSHEERQRFPYVRTLNDLVWTEGSMMPNPEASGVPVGAPGSYAGPVSLAVNQVTAASSSAMPLQATATMAANQAESGSSAVPMSSGGRGSSSSSHAKQSSSRASRKHSTSDAAASSNNASGSGSTATTNPAQSTGASQK